MLEFLATLSIWHILAAFGISLGVVGLIVIRLTTPRVFHCIETINLNPITADTIIYENSDHVVIRAHETSCWACTKYGRYQHECPYSFDPYNINGDCLASK